MNSYKNKFFSFFILCCFTLFSVCPVWAGLTIADIDETEFSSRHGIDFSLTETKSSSRQARVAFFDVDQQKYASINYCIAPSSRSSYKGSFRKSGFDIQYHLDGGSLKITIDSTINLAADFWITISKNVVVGWDAKQMGLEITDIPSDGSRNDRVLIRKLGEQDKAGNLKELLKKFETRRKETNQDLHVTFRLDDEDLSTNLKLLGKKNGLAGNPGYNCETRFLGELTTDLTMMAFGFVKLPTKLKADQGLDGVYIPKAFYQMSTGALTQLWVTEAKCNHTYGKVTPDKILDEIRYKLRSDKSLGVTVRSSNIALKRTADLVYRFIEEAPQEIQLLGHRVLGDGTVHLKFEGFNSEIYWKTEESFVSSDVRRVRSISVKSEEGSNKRVYEEGYTNGLRDAARSMIRYMSESDILTSLKISQETLNAWLGRFISAHPKIPIKIKLKPRSKVTLFDSSEQHVQALTPKKLFLENFFQEPYQRPLVTLLLNGLPTSTATSLAKHINRDAKTGIMSKLKDPEKYGPNEPAAKLVWGLFQGKAYEEIRHILGKDLDTVAEKLGFK